MTGNYTENVQDADFQIAWTYLNKAMDYIHCCTELRDEYLQPELDKYKNIRVERTKGKSDTTKQN